MKPIWQVCEFNDDVKYGRLDPSRFAVELHSVLDGRADPVYTDPELFLLNTHPTSNMKFIVREALRRLSAKGGQPIFILDTEFGGGKTHTLLLLYHLFNNKKLGTRYIREYGLDRETGVLEIPEVRLVTIDCREVRKRTLWGELADRLGQYEKFKDEDLIRQPIKEISKIKALFDKPTLILIDELPDYLLRTAAEKVGDTTLSDLTLSFVMNLISAISATKDSMLIITLTGKQSLYERYVNNFKSAYQKLLKSYIIEEIHEKATEAFSRQAQFIVPIEKSEVPYVIKRRLIKSINDEMENVVKDFFSYLMDKGIIGDIRYEDELKRSYPFHPFFIDVLYERISTIEEFNKTRGILRLLAMVLHRIYRDKIDCPLVSTGDIPLDDPEINDELTSRLGRGELKPVIETDCIKKARGIDEKKKTKLAEKIARTIYLYSLIGATKVSGIRESDIKLAVCKPGIDPGLVNDILNEMDTGPYEFWYLKSEAGAYYFDKEPNINKIIHDYKREVRKDEVRNCIKDTLTSLLPKSQGIETIVWERELLEDKAESLMLFAVDYSEIPKDEKEFLTELLERRVEGGLRSFRNTIILLFPEKEAIDNLIQSATQVCAIEKAKKDERIRLDKDRIKKIDEKLELAKGALVSDCMNIYSKLAFPRVGDGQIQIEDLGIEGKKESLTDIVLELLRKKGKLVDELSPNALVDILNEDESRKGIIKIEDLYTLFRTDRRKPFILSGMVVLKAVKDGVREGSFGYSDQLIERDGKYIATINETINPKWSGWILKPDLIYKKEEKVEQKESGERVETILLHKFNIRCEDLNEVIDNINKLRVISIGKKMDIELSIEVSNESEIIKISSKMKKPEELRSLLSILNSKGYIGKGLFIISSQEDLTEDFKQYNVRGIRA